MDGTTSKSVERQVATARSYLYALVVIGVAMAAIFASGLGNGGRTNTSNAVPGVGQAANPSGPNYPTIPGMSSGRQLIPGGQAVSKAEEALDTGLDAAKRGAEVAGKAIDRVGDAISEP